MNTKKVTSLLTIAMLVAIVPPLYADASSMPDAPSEFEKITINGAGATFPFPLIDLWRVKYNEEFSSVNLNYQSIGSGGGVKQHIEKTVNFAASDKPMSQKEQDAAPGTLHIPEAIGGVVIAYNVPEIPEKGLNLTGEIIADIFLDKIKNWNDPRIAEINPGVNLPDHEIITVHRSDGSGTTFVFTDYVTTLSQEFDEKIGKGKSVPWVSGLGAAGNEGVAGTIRSTPYSIGYIELAYAFQTGMSYAFVQNGDRTAFIEPTLESISAASGGVAEQLPEAQQDWSWVSLVNAPGPDSYPIASFTYLLVYDDLQQVTKSKEQAKAALHMIHWMITDGQNYSPDLLYVPLSDAVVEIGKKGLAQVSYGDDMLWEYDSGVMTQTSSSPDTSSSDLEIPSWIRDNARWWADGMISDQDYINGLQYLISKGILKV